MITVRCKNYFRLDQREYDALANELTGTVLQCPYCGKKLIRWGHYSRRFFSNEGKSKVVLQRVRCVSCLTTHAILPAFLVPYSQIPLFVQLKIIEHISNGRITRPFNDIYEFAEELDESGICYVCQQYTRHWVKNEFAGKEFLHNPGKACEITLKKMKRQFMQVRLVNNFLY